ncbi:MAG: hypothetical protein JWQ10_1961, partial [Herbaspirillum sp.]|nr:hypothetical protein [Herbaspirillum sp.]
YSGFVLTFEPERTQWLAEKLYPGAELKESFSALDWTFERRELVLLVLSITPMSISAIALMERMHGSGGSGKLKMRMSNMVIFDEPVIESEFLIADVSSVICTPETLKRTDPISWEALIIELCQRRPEYANSIHHLISSRETERRILGQSNRVARLNEQRDGLGLALDIGQIERAAVMKTIKVEKIEAATSVLDLLDALPVQESSLIEHDAKIFRVLLGEQTYRSGIFSDYSDRSVRVYVADKTILETVLGIDLIIYSTCYENFLLLQYKKMDKVGYGWTYPISPTSNLHSQLSSMARFRNTASASVTSPPPSLWSYRLNEDPFYFKFCEEFRPDARDDSLVPGITLSENHLREFLALPEAKGPMGGIAVGYHNCPRYLNNTEFIQLARVGWIGAGRQSTALLKHVLDENRKGGRAAMLAIVDIPKGKSASGRARRK